MVWSLALDDFGKMCKSSSRPYPLISTIRDELIQAEKGFARRRIQTTTTTPLPPNPDDGKLFKLLIRFSDAYHHFSLFRRRYMHVFDGNVDIVLNMISQLSHLEVSLLFVLTSL